MAADRSCEVLAPLLGEPILTRAVRGLLASGVVDEAVVLVRPEVCNAAVRLLADLPVVVDVDPAVAVKVVDRARSGGTAAVLLHDAARPLTPPALAAAVTRSVVAAVHGSAVPVLPLADTVKHVDAAGGLVIGSPDRAGLRVVQTPQAFRADLLDCDLLYRVLVSDAPVEHAWAEVGVPATTVPGHPLAFAVRSAWERELAEVLAGETVHA